MSKSALFFSALLASSLAACAGGQGMDGNSDKADEFAADAGAEDEGEGEGEEIVEDGYELARDVDVHEIVFDEETLAPEFYSVPEHDSDFRLGGTEFWQRFEGGEMPTFSYSAGTDAGRRCMYASAIRFSTIMADPPEEILAVLENTNWGGSFFNWNDDFFEGSGSASGPRLWAWRTHLIKWISQTDADGTCYLPTRDMLIQVALDCADTAERNEGEIQGCSAR